MTPFSKPQRRLRILVSALTALSVAGAPTLALAQQAQPQQQRPAGQGAQQQRPPAGQQPAQQPAGAQNTGPTVVQVRPEPSQTEWTKVCGRDPGNNREICYTTRDFVSDQGQPVMAVAVYDVKGDATRIIES